MSIFRPSLIRHMAAVVGLLFIAPISTANAAVFDQLGETFNAVLINGEIAVDSQNDVGAPSPFRADFAISYDSFVFTDTLSLTTIDFIGFYADADFASRPLASSFDVAIWASDPLTNQPLTNNGAIDSGTGLPTPVGVPLFQQTFSNSDLDPLSIGGTGFFYTADVSAGGFIAAANTDYFLSIVANLNSDDNGFGLAFSDTAVGDGTSFQDFEELDSLPPQRFSNGGDLAFRITAVPEPSSMLALVAIGGLAFRRRRRVARLSC